VNKIFSGFRRAFDGGDKARHLSPDRRPLLEVDPYGWGVDGSYFPEAKF
jgi:hypothetical protein